MVALGLVELECRGQRLEHALRGTGQAAALHPDVVVDRDPGEHRHLLAAQPLDPPVAAVCRQPRLLGGQAGTARGEERVFHRFGRVSSAIVSDGHGLGLAIARQVLESHGGRVALHSEVGVGSTFVLWLPDRASPHAGVRAHTPPENDPLGRR